MKCYMCKGDLEQGRRPYVVTLDNCVIIVKDVPALICSQCGDVYYTDEVSEKLEQIVDRVKLLMQEVAIVEYDKVA